MIGNSISNQKRIRAIQNRQATRQMKFPEDRIALLKGEHAADADKMVLNDWERSGRWKKGKAYRLALQKAMDAIAKNNKLEEITIVQFDTLCQITGYGRVSWGKLEE